MSTRWWLLIAWHTFRKHFSPAFRPFAMAAKTDIVGYRGYRATAMSQVRFGHE